ncbi:Sterol-sensing domain and Patched family-containing protein [Strongyloides ratti]|uniref:Sterol-sensing domain and Patched family-containing protein n=1 Tax=Strongyloides ratti TaxID=34506 RepID=A0A090MXT2_STRRB|nr:Sterol-sensing domain and Patched family-containing protein [Strongyloides ratti]CEF65979.1 Sterol-sensing domain and Patched family-containing protein [Strongyloides ratti]
MPTNDCIEKPLAIFFHNYGVLVAKYPYPFILIPIIITSIMSIGIFHLNTISDAIYLFTPSDAPSKMERQVIHNLWPLTNDNYVPGRAVTQSREIQIIITTKDNGNILEPHYAEAIWRLDMYIQNRVKVNINNETYKYDDLCLMYKKQGCPGNKHIHLISSLYNHGINITYPTVRLGDKSGYIGGALGDVRLTNGPNNTKIVVSAKAWMMLFHLKFYPTNVSYISGLWEKELEYELFNYPDDPYIEFTFFHSQTLAEELKRNANSLVPRFILSFTFCVIFSMISSFTFIKGTFLIDWVQSKPIVAILGVANAGLGIATAIGGLNLGGMYYSDIVGVMPFLIVAVGVDNMFLMLAAIKRTPRTQATEERMGECLSEAAVSMLITSFTDSLSFGVGALTTIPSVNIFCIYTCVAISMTFIYEITFFAGILALSIELEKKNRHSVILCKTTVYDNKKKYGIMTKLFMLGSDNCHTDIDPSLKFITTHGDIIEDSLPAHFFRKYFGPILMTTPVKIMVIVWYCIYLVFAGYGCSNLKEGLEPVNLLVRDSYAIPHYRNLEKYFWHYGSTVQVVVNNPPDLRNSTERKNIKMMVHDFANTKHTIGDDSIQFWLNEMEKYYSSEADTTIKDEYYYSFVQHYMAAKSNEYWPEDVKWVKDSNGTWKIGAFRFIVGLRNIVSSVEQTDATITLREVASRYTKYNVTTFMPIWLFTDQYSLVIPNTVQNTVIAMIMMFFIALFLIPQPICAVWVTVAIASMDFGTIGFMTLWGVNLDAISMITIIMSIGFSVDYSAHITYGYVVSKEKTSQEKIIDALAALGWPLIQGGSSTILAICVLADVPAYMIVTFFKTVFLAISVGLLHGLIFLPVFLSLFVHGCCIIGDNDDDDNNNQKVCLEMSTSSLDKSFKYSNNINNIKNSTFKSKNKEKIIYENYKSGNYNNSFQLERY